MLTDAFILLSERLAGWLCARSWSGNATACQKVEESRHPDWRASTDCSVRHRSHHHCSYRSGSLCTTSHHISLCPSLQPTLASAGVVGAGLVWGKPLPQDGIEDRVYRSGTVLST